MGSGRIGADNRPPPVPSIATAVDRKEGIDKNLPTEPAPSDGEEKPRFRRALLEPQYQPSNEHWEDYQYRHYDWSQGLPSGTSRKSGNKPPEDEGGSPPLTVAETLSEFAVGFLFGGPSLDLLPARKWGPAGLPKSFNPDLFTTNGQRQIDVVPGRNFPEVPPPSSAGNISSNAVPQGEWLAQGKAPPETNRPEFSGKTEKAVIQDVGQTKPNTPPKRVAVLESSGSAEQLNGRPLGPPSRLVSKASNRNYDPPAEFAIFLDRYNGKRRLNILAHSQLQSDGELKIMGGNGPKSADQVAADINSIRHKFHFDNVRIISCKSADGGVQSLGQKVADLTGLPVKAYQGAVHTVSDSLKPQWSNNSRVYVLKTRDDVQKYASGIIESFPPGRGTEHVNRLLETIEYAPVKFTPIQDAPLNLSKKAFGN
ncbi:hypothetical protein [Paraburkholderia sp. SG-MS1]|uniref:hypothetical protein n=1 Tax=Paraburkholderia sp. SG-MS1 TaxID=2023741 RepID=UPI001EEA57B9|nr:hypothetical protein [Paraburkholderia sp. SG-MS1]